MLSGVVIGVLLLTVLATACAQVLLKIGADRVSALAAGGPRTTSETIVSAASDPALLGGLALYALATMAWIFVLSRLPLSLAYPFVGFSFIAVMVLSASILGESITTLRILGTALVTVGVTLVAASA